MKKILSLLAAILISINISAQAEWDFGEISSVDFSELNKDSENWYYDADKDRYSFQKALEVQELVAGGSVLGLTQGLFFTAPAITNDKTKADGVVRLDVKNECLNLNGTVTVTIKNQKKGNILTISAKSSNKSTARTINIISNITNTSSFGETSTDKQSYTGTVTEDGDIAFQTGGGHYVYSITIEDPSQVIPDDNTNNAVAFNLFKNQANLQLHNGDTKYYNTESLSSIDIDGSTITVNAAGANEPDVYNGTVAKLGFKKAVADDGTQGSADNSDASKVQITEAKGWLESAYVKFTYSNADSFVVKIMGGQYSDWHQLDPQLIRKYDSYYRADAVGLIAAEDYAFQVIPATTNGLITEKANQVAGLVVKNYSRSGFAHKNYSGVGAYADDGQLKSGAKVFYVTAANAKTISTTVKGAKSNPCVGIQTIIDAYEKGEDSTPIAFRLIGKVTQNDLDHISSSAEGLQVKGRNNTSPMNITIEGIGEDATVSGFGFLIRNALSVEFRNFAIMDYMDDGLSFDTDNSHCWAHNIDIFYGQVGGDSDQAKGDGSVDVKGDSQYMTFDNIHFWDAGKSSLCGMKSESGPNYITYHHNWFDHSDSRHPRVRTMTVHVWNNYFDGNSKYGVGATTGSDVFVENNFFRSCKYPMLTSLQGSDMLGGKGTFSGESGGSIKSFGNIFTGKYIYAPYSEKNTVEFDAFEVSSRDEQVPGKVTAKSGGATYSNFDTDNSVMYNYTPDAAEYVPAVVCGWYGAGRMNHGDLQYAFNSSEDGNYGVINDLKSLIQNYTSPVKKFFGINGTSSETGGGEEGGSSGEEQPGGTTISADMECTFSANGPSNNAFICSKTDGKPVSYPKDKGPVIVNDVEYNYCLKVESKTQVSFTIDKEMTIKIVIGPKSATDIKIDGNSINATDNVITKELSAGSHIITRGSGEGHIFYIALSE